MDFIDTNYLIRFFTNDRPPQASVAKRLIKQSKEIFIPTIVVAETVFILENHYKTKKDMVCNKLLSLIKQPNIKTQSFIQMAIQVYETENISFYDSLILCETIEKNSQLKTFDKKLSKIYLKYSS